MGETVTPLLSEKPTAEIIADISKKFIEMIDGLGEKKPRGWKSRIKAGKNGLSNWHELSAGPTGTWETTPQKPGERLETTVGPNSEWLYLLIGEKIDGTRVLTRLTVHGYDGEQKFYLWSSGLAENLQIGEKEFSPSENNMQQIKQRLDKTIIALAKVVANPDTGKPFFIQAESKPKPVETKK